GRAREEGNMCPNRPTLSAWSLVRSAPSRIGIFEAGFVPWLDMAVPPLLVTCNVFGAGRTSQDTVALRKYLRPFRRCRRELPQPTAVARQQGFTAKAPRKEGKLRQVRRAGWRPSLRPLPAFLAPWR